ncbi:unnamed protein product [Psylliodes chrysocephalus]|uniref:Reverse transcriptase domain-containing protein n=1 Tax=Psylliodes chrysocephalus TaxID=3402493 RepID=A0A9P0GER4_9CUCU|nr:unnamed protein product [Psylliodes chrysocephala]
MTLLKIYHVILYVDDLKLFKSISSVDDCLIMQENLNKLNLWCNSNNLPLNVSKCNSISFTRKLNPIEYNFTVNNINLHKCLSFRDLGVLFDAKLNFIEHVNTIQKEAYRNLGFVIRNGRQFSEPNTLKTIFNAFVRSKLEYASIVWSPGYEVHSQALEKIQRKFVKYL